MKWLLSFLLWLLGYPTFEDFDYTKTGVAPLVTADPMDHKEQRPHGHHQS